MWNFTIKRVFFINKEENIESLLREMVIFHDIGKLTKRWQENLGTNKKLPSHASIGAAYLYKKFTRENHHDDLKNAIVFAVAIHHTDSGLLGDNIERPDVLAIIEWIVDNDGKIKWSDETKTLDENLFPEELNELTIKDLKNMARGLRIWARSAGFLEQHKKRIQASLIHHILKLCDISAASERKEYQKENDQDYYGGWLMVENIKKYVDNLQIRMISEEIRKKFNPQKIILFGSYAYGNPTRNSDIDLFIIMDTKLPVRKQAFLIRKEIKSYIPVDIIVRTPEQVEERIKMGDFFIKHIIQKGIYL
jgi:CRISPR-associated endonuclease Cas3-HD